MSDPLDVLGTPKPVPTAEQVLEGRIGNGSDSLELAKAYQAGARKSREEGIVGRQKLYEEAMKSHLAAIGELEVRALGVAELILGKLEKGEELGRQDVAALKMTYGVMKEMKDRAVGKSVAKTEVSGGVGILHQILGGSSEGMSGLGLESPAIDVEAIEESSFDD